MVNDQIITILHIVKGMKSGQVRINSRQVDLSLALLQR